MANAIAKTLLKNHIRHAGTHNKMVEEKEMWKEYNKKKEFEKDSKYSFLQDSRVDMRVEFSDHRDQRAHMDDEPETYNSTFYLRKLYKAEDKDPDRWGHSGFKELYPKDFDSDRSDEDKRRTKTVKMKRRKEKKRKKEKKRRKKKYKSETDESEDKRNNKKRKYSKYSNHDINFETDESRDRTNSKKRKHSKFSNLNSDSEPDYKKTKRKESENYDTIERKKNHKRKKSKKAHRNSDSKSEFGSDRNKHSMLSCDQLTDKKLSYARKKTKHRTKYRNYSSSDSESD